MKEAIIYSDLEFGDIVVLGIGYTIIVIYKNRVRKFVLWKDIKELKTHIDTIMYEEYQDGWHGFGDYIYDYIESIK